MTRVVQQRNTACTVGVRGEGVLDAWRRVNAQPNATDAEALEAMRGDPGEQGAPGPVDVASATNADFLAKGVSAGLMKADASNATRYRAYDDGSWKSLVASGAAYAAKGLFFTPDVAMYVRALFPKFTPVSGATYKCVVAAVNASRVIQSITSSTPRTLSTTTTGRYQFDFPSPPALAAGTMYALMLVRTDNSTTYGLPILSAGDSNFYVALPGTVAGYVARLASISPAVGDTVDHNGGVAGWYQIGMCADVVL